MALTRKFLTALGVEAEKIDEIINAHTETVDALKSERDGYKAEADKLPGVQKQLDDLKADVKANYVPKADADKIKTDFDAYKADVEKKARDAAKTAAARAYFEGNGIRGNSLEIAMRGSGKEIDGLELDGDGKTIKDTKALDDLISDTYAGLVTKETVTPFTAPTPPAQGTPAAPKQQSKAAALYQQHYSALYGAQKGTTDT